MAITVTRGDKVFDLYFKDISREDMVNKFRSVPFACAVIKNLPPRDEQFEYIRDMGLGNIAAVFEAKKISVGKNGDIHFVFPERWMSVQEQQAFADRICQHPQVKKGEVKGIFIITSSPLIIGNMHREQVRVLEFPDKQLYA
jgi:hypothetical protein